MESEKWRDIIGFEGLYQVSSFGNIRSFYRDPPKIIKPSLTPNGYPKVTLSKKGVHYNKIIHHMVADVFLNNKPTDAECVNHIDGNKQNNHLDNLEWTTHSLNRKHAFANGLNLGRTNVGKGVKVLDTTTGISTIYPTRSAVARLFGFDLTWVHDTIRRKGNPFTYKHYIIEGGNQYGRL